MKNFYINWNRGVLDHPTKSSGVGLSFILTLRLRAYEKLREIADMYTYLVFVVLLLSSFLSPGVLSEFSYQAESQIFLAQSPSSVVDNSTTWSLEIHTENSCPDDRGSHQTFTGEGQQDCHSFNSSQRSYRFWGDEKLKVCFYERPKGCSDETYIDENIGNARKSCKDIKANGAALAYAILPEGGDCHVSSKVLVRKETLTCEQAKV